jgi:hypothetical protein
MGADFCRRVCPRSCTSSLAGITGSTFLRRRPRYPLPLQKDGMRLLVARSLRGHDARFSPTQATERQWQHCGRCRPDRQNQIGLERNSVLRGGGGWLFTLAAILSRSEL